MKKIKVMISALLLLGLVGCANNNTVPTDEYRAKLDKILEIVSQNNQVDETPAGVYTFKDFVNMEVTVLDKIEGDELHPNLLLVTNPDRDHNTPLIFTVENRALYDSINIDTNYNMEIYIINVIQKEDSHTRFEFLLTKVL